MITADHAQALLHIPSSGGLTPGQGVTRNRMAPFLSFRIKFAHKPQEGPGTAPGSGLKFAERAISTFIFQNDPRCIRQHEKRSCLQRGKGFQQQWKKPGRDLNLTSKTNWKQQGNLL